MKFQPRKEFLKTGSTETFKYVFAQIWASRWGGSVDDSDSEWQGRQFIDVCTRANDEKLYAAEDYKTMLLMGFPFLLRNEAGFI